MLTLDQVNLLANKVTQAVERIRVLTEENKTLAQRLAEKTDRVTELESIVSAFKEDQGRIEEGILSALSRLSEFEDAVLIQNELPAVKTPEPAVPMAAPVTEPQTPAVPDSAVPSFAFGTTDTIVPEPAPVAPQEQELSFEPEIPEIF